MNLPQAAARGVVRRWDLGCRGDVGFDFMNRGLFGSGAARPAQEWTEIHPALTLIGRIVAEMAHGAFISSGAFLA